MTDEQYNKALTLVIGECWHEFISVTRRSGDCEFNIYKCKLCGLVEIDKPVDIDHLTNPIPFIKWMKKKMPKEFEEYLRHVELKQYYPKKDLRYTIVLDYILNLRNIIDYWRKK